MDKFLKIHYQPEDKLLRWKVMPNKSALIDWTYRTCPPPFPHSPLHRSGLYIYIGLTCETFANSSDEQVHSVWGITEPFVLGDEMTESGGLVRLLISRSQHVSWARLGSLEVTKSTIVPLDPSAFSATDHLPLPLSARMQNNKTFHCLPK